MIKNKFTLIAGVMIFASSTFVQAEPYVYPAKGQSADQMEQDKYQCYGWGKQQSGFDPMNPPVVSSGRANTAPVVGGAVRGSAGVVQLSVPLQAKVPLISNNKLKQQSCGYCTNA